jgi:4-hydroxy-tetrahydrodipicolinate synthase
MFQGTYTAIITPFTSSGAVDYDQLKVLIERQAASGVDGVVPVGTTGESPTLNVDEHKQVIATAIACKGSMKVIAGTGGNSTDEALELTRFAMDAGADGTLQVTPYYNKPSQEGLYRHFSKVADVGLPVVLYNVPGRTSREITVDTVARLASHDNIVAVKEAGGSVERVSATLQACDITVLSGDDALTLPMMILGAKGVVSVISNVAPGTMVELTHAALKGDWVTAQACHNTLFPLMSGMLSLDTNPVPVKAALAMMNLCEEVYRLPLCSMDEQAKAILSTLLRDAGVA